MAPFWIIASAMASALANAGAGFCGQAQLDAGARWERALDNADGVYVVTLARSAVSGPETAGWDDAPGGETIAGVLDRARASAAQMIEYEFRVLDVIYGDRAGTVSVSLPLRGAPDDNRHFDNHNDPAFWDDPAAGRAMIAGDCSVVANFRYGDTYILIRSDDWTVRSFERVVSRDDRFYQYLVERFQGG